MLSTFISQGSRKVSRETFTEDYGGSHVKNTCYYVDDSEKSVMPASKTILTHVFVCVL